MFTCNLKWTEITAELEPEQEPHDQQDLVARLFNIKLWELMTNLIERNIFGTMVGKVWMFEFLLHKHIMIILNETFKLRTLQQIDLAVYVKISESATHPDTYETVMRCLVHGLCDRDNPKASCVKEVNQVILSTVCE